MLTRRRPSGKDAASARYIYTRLSTITRSLFDERDDAIARADAADATLASCNRARQAAEAECERLRAELSVARDLLSGVPEHSAGWYADICDYLETLDNTR